MSNPVFAPGPAVTVVLKVGSSSLATADGKHLNLPTLAKLVEAICDLRKSNIDVVLVTSGAVAVGCQRMRLAERPKDLITKQAVAAIGQGRLMRVYDDLFSQLEQPVAQVLLSRENLNKQHHYTNALNTLRGLLRLGVVPIINENDTVAVEELRFGDNDTLSALVASLLEAEWLFLLTDVDSLYTADPRRDPSARPIRTVRNMDEIKADVGPAASAAPAAVSAARVAPALSPSAPFSSSAAAVPSASGMWGTGGMATKLTAASIATRAGVRTVIIKSTEPSQIQRIILEGGCEKVGTGTEFFPQERPIKGRKKWIAHGMRPSGTLLLDQGAASAVRAHSSLFAAGIAGVLGEFPAQSCVVLADLGGKEIARGVVEYSSAEIELIRGKSSAQYEEALGYAGSDEVVTRDNLAITTAPVPSASPPPAAHPPGPGADPSAAAKGPAAAHSS